MLSLLACAAFGSTGPLTVTTQDLVFTDPEFGRGKVHARIYTPPVEDGPYPLVAFLHGWLGEAWMYDDVCQEVASWGFVVASTDTETGLVLNYGAFAEDTEAILHYVADGDEDWLAGLVSDAPWSAMGHSMGGGTLAQLTGVVPEIRQFVAFMPYQGETAADYDTLASFAGAGLYLDATEDTTAPIPMTDKWFGSFAGDRGLKLTIEGAGHMAVTDDPWGEATSMPHADQHKAVIGLATAFLRAEVLGDEDRYRDLVGPGAPDVFAAVASNSPRPALWAELDGDRIALGVVGEPDQLATVEVGAAVDGEDLVDPVVVADDQPLVDGWTVLDEAVPEGDGALWVQVLVDGAPTRAVWLRDALATTTTAPTEPTDPTEPATTPIATDPVPSHPDRPEVAAGCGCGGSRPVGAWVVGLALLVRRRASSPR